MKYSTSLVAAILTTAACHSRQPVIYATSEGSIRFAEQPPFFRPARELNPGLRSANRGRLVVQTRVGLDPSGARVTIAGPGVIGRQLEQVSNSGGVTEFDDLSPGDYTATARHVGLRPQSVRLTIAAGYTDTLQFSLGQP